MITKPISLYRGDGEIIACIQCAHEEIEANVAGNMAYDWIEGEFPGHTYWVDTTQIPAVAMEKATIEPMVKVSGMTATLSGLPTPCQVEVLGAVHTVEDGEAVLSFDAPGSYAITLSAPPRFLSAVEKVDIS